MMKDPATCPECSKEFDAFGLYGRNVPCPHCGKKWDIFPDDDIYLDTALGIIGVSSVNGLSGGVMRNVKWIANLLKHSKEEK